MCFVLTEQSVMVLSSHLSDTVLCSHLFTSSSVTAHNCFFQAEKAKQLLYQVKYGRYGQSDPYTALQRDAFGTIDSSFDESSVNMMYDNQLTQLENLIATQHGAQMRMGEQLSSAEKRYCKVY